MRNVACLYVPVVLLTDSFSSLKMSPVLSRALGVADIQQQHQPVSGQSVLGYWFLLICLPSLVEETLAAMPVTPV